MKKVICIACSVLFFLGSCKKEYTPPSSLPEIVFEVNKNTEDYYDLAEELTDELEIIPLETTDEALIARVGKIVMANDSYYILDPNSHMVFRFSSTGKHLFTLNKRGSGPDEYIGINDFIVKDEDIWICDNWGRKALCYDKGGNLIHTINTQEENLTFTGLTYDQDHIYLINDWTGVQETNYSFAVYNLQDKTIDFQRPFSPMLDFMYLTIAKQIAASEDKCLLVYSLCDTIFEIKDQTLVPLYHIVFPKEVAPLTMSMAEYENEKNKNRLKGIYKMSQTKESILLELFVDENHNYIFFNKATHTTKVYPRFYTSDLGNMNILGPCFFPDNTILFPFDANNFQLYYTYNLKQQEFKRESDREKFEEAIRNIQDGDNPVLIKLKLKENGNL